MSSAKVANGTGVEERNGIVHRMMFWCAPVALACMQFVDFRDGVHGRPAVVSAYLVGFCLLAALLVPVIWTQRHEVTRAGRWIGPGFLLLFLWTLLRAGVGGVPTLYLMHHTAHRSWYTSTRVGRIYLVVPALTALAVFVSSWGLALAVPRARRVPLLWWTSLVLVISTVLAWPRSALATHSARLATGLGGAAVIHVALLLALGQLLGAAIVGRARLVGGLAAAACVIAIVLTGSRAGFICLAVFVVLVAIWGLVRGRRRLLVPLVGGATLVVALALAFVPTARHLVQTSDPGRAANMAAGKAVFRHSVGNAILGTGPGRVWPWYPFETGALPVPWQQFIKTDFGLEQRTLTNPHSVFLAVFVELGLVGGLLLVALVLMLLWRAILVIRGGSGRGEAVDGARGTDDQMRVRQDLGLIALMATLPAFFFDYYLFKNFGVSFCWWLVVALTLGVRTSATARSDVADIDPDVPGERA